MKFNLLDNNRFYLQEGNQRISYSLIYSLLLKMHKNGQKKEEINWKDCYDKEKVNNGEIEILEEEEGNIFKFKIDESSKLIIEGKKKNLFSRR